MTDGVNNKGIKIGKEWVKVNDDGIQKGAFGNNKKHLSIFKAFDKDNNGILDKQEIQNLKQEIETHAGKYNKTSLGNREAARFFKENGIEVNGEKMSRDDLLEFLKVLGSDADLVDSATTNGNGIIEVKYKKEGETQKTEWYTKAKDSEQSVLLVSKEENEKDQTTKITVYQENGNISQETEENKAKGTKLETFYSDECNEDGTQKISKRTRTTATNLQGSLILQTEETLDSEHNNRVTYKERKTVNQNPDVYGQTTLQDKTTYKYDDNGKVAEEKVEEGNREVTTEFKDGKKTKSTTELKNENKTVVENYDENGKVSKKETKEIGNSYDKTATEEGNTTTTVLNSKDGKEIQKTTDEKNANGDVIKSTVKKGDKEYSAEYTENGNTKGVIVQNGESPEMIAKKFGVKVEDLKEANKSKLKGGGKYFLVGEEIVIPGKADPEKFSKINAERKTREQAIADYTSAIQNDNSPVTSTQSTAQTTTQTNLDSEEKEWAEYKKLCEQGDQIFGKIKNASQLCLTNDLIAALNSITEDNVAHVISHFNFDDWAIERNYLVKTLQHLPLDSIYIISIGNKLFAKAEKLGIATGDYKSKFEKAMNLYTIAAFKNQTIKDIDNIFSRLAYKIATLRWDST